MSILKPKLKFIPGNLSATSFFPPSLPSTIDVDSPRGTYSATRHRFPSNLMSILTPTFDRLETGRGAPSNGLGPSRTRRKWFNWKKFLIGASVLITVVWFFGPRTSLSLKGANQKWSESMTKFDQWRHSGHDSVGDDDEFDLDLSSPPSPTRPASQTHTQTQGKHPKTFEEDKDPSMSTYCPKKGSDAVRFGLMIDAGSTGSRIHVYKFNTCTSSSNPVYEYEVFKATKPGLSYFPKNNEPPTAAAESLDILLDEALRVVPKKLHKCTLVSVKATAGLRLLGEQQSSDVLEAVRKRLQTKYPFPIVKGKGGIAIMDGSDEGVYAWITTNYLLGTIAERSSSSSPPSTFAVLDLGGASTQIVFKPTFESNTMEPGEHKYDLAFGGQHHELYQHSYLGYGLMRARESVHGLVTFMYDMRAPSRPTLSKAGDIERIGNPCIGKGMSRDVEITDEKTGEKRTVKMEGSDFGSFDSCMRVVSLVMAKDSLCEVKPCSFSGVYQPSLLNTFSTGKVLLLSYFYDRVAPLLEESDSALRLSGKGENGSGSKRRKITVKTISELAKTVCDGPESYKALWSKDKKGETPESTLWEDLNGRPEYCLDLTFMYGLLRLGYEFEDSREVYFGKQIDGTELGWSLGAGIEMVGGADVRCEI